MTMMISKFHKLIQSKVVWGIFLVVVIVAFVGVYTPGSGRRSAQRQEQQEAQRAGTLFGKEIDRQEFNGAYRSIYILYSMNSMMYGQRLEITPEVDTFITEQAWQWLATLKKARQLKISAHPDEVRAMIESERIFQGQNGQFDANIYKRFANGFMASNRMTEQDLERLYTEQVIIRKVHNMAAQGALVTEAEIKKAFHMYMDRLTVEYAAIPRAVVKDVAVSDTEVEAYFEANKEQFRMPEKVMVQYVEFPVSNYLAGIEVTDEMATNHYEQNKYSYIIAPAEGAEPSAEPQFKPLEAVKDEVTAKLMKEKAQQKATDLADQFVGDMSDEAATFEAVAKKTGLKIIGNVPAFSKTETVKGVDPTAQFPQMAFTLQDDPDHYYSDPAIGDDAVYVLALVKKYDSFIPKLATVKEDVTAAARATAEEKAYVLESEKIHQEVKTTLAGGVAFTNAVAKYELEVKKTVPFTVSTQLTDEFGREIKSTAIFHNQGELCELIPTRGSFLLAYVAEKIPGDEVNQLPGMRAELVSGLSGEKAGQMVQAWRESILNEAGFEDLMKRSKEEEETSSDS
ncbi:MAG: SurA N-terminal domain-containing protein [Kiritimatiellales bacterium]|nr:SurA N-terminal domain-containing protein [Kiritimatiellales bacterium]